MKADAVADLAAIERLREQFVAAENSGDAAAVAALYTDDAVLLPPNELEVVGRPAIEAWYRALFDTYAPELSFSSQEVQLAGDWAFDWLSYTFQLTPRAGGPAIEERGNDLLVLRRQADGAWKVAREIWNADGP